MATLKVQVVTPDRTYFEGDASKLIVPAWDGEMGILPGHAPLIARLGHGGLRVTPEPAGKVVSLAVYGGFLKVQDDDVIVLAAGVGEGKALERAVVAAGLEKAKEKVEVTRPPRATEAAHEEALEAFRRARANVAAGKLAGV